MQAEVVLPGRQTARGWMRLAGGGAGFQHPDWPTALFAAAYLGLIAAAVLVLGL